jgi:AAA15 family ATPase/GTPase
MILNRLRISNFRSMDDVDFELSPLTVLVGPNAAGKSNILDALQFVSDVLEHAPAPAVEERRGADYTGCPPERQTPHVRRSSC